jgi:dihydroorotase
MRRFIVEPAKTDIFCFLNVAKTGLVSMPEIRDEHDIDPELSKQVVEENRDIIKGIKLRAVQSVAEGIGIKAIEIAKKLATDLKLPLMMHIGEPRERVANDIMDDFTRTAVKLMEKGDILSHIMTWEAGGLILPDGMAYPEIWEAQRRGVILDSCHGFWHFSFIVARHALQLGLLPTVISTDLAVPPMPAVQSLMVTMSKFLNLGLTIDQVVEMTTINPAKALGEEAQRGSLTPGMPANISVVEIVEGKYFFSDALGRNSIRGNLLLEPRLVLKAGMEMPCRSHYHLPPVYTTLPH